MRLFRSREEELNDDALILKALEKEKRERKERSYGPPGKLKAGEWPFADKNTIDHIKETYKV